MSPRVHTILSKGHLIQWEVYPPEGQGLARTYSRQFSPSSTFMQWWTRALWHCGALQEPCDLRWSPKGASLNVLPSLLQLLYHRYDDCKETSSNWEIQITAPIRMCLCTRGHSQGCHHPGSLERGPASFCLQRPIPAACGDLNRPLCHLAVSLGS